MHDKFETVSRLWSHGEIEATSALRIPYLEGDGIGVAAVRLRESSSDGLAYTKNCQCYDRARSPSNLEKEYGHSCWTGTRIKLFMPMKQW